MAAQLYNKPEHRHTLIGNWQEEQKLLETTGTHRYKVGLQVQLCLPSPVLWLCGLDSHQPLCCSHGCRATQQLKLTRPDGISQSSYKLLRGSLHTLKERYTCQPELCVAATQH